MIDICMLVEALNTYDLAMLVHKVLTKKKRRKSYVTCIDYLQEGKSARNEHEKQATGNFSLSEIQYRLLKRRQIVNRKVRHMYDISWPPTKNHKTYSRKPERGPRLAHLYLCR